ncbi:uncharacterized protein BDW43DRAFT_259481 [Aspergillus alliaceus]|uniref:uncharacterized protein n=1 Tax=Petromyces alliaceus TaxID=209559 RepID=UPI0012A51C1F|nr:uncharacterized protein BDW43DRAFT_259481 [Aspergillus alliaceus]KAB8239857.1 hypothetical protein BDW43DRAFT_259481 [Aspergillus alliaceus]
MVESTYLPTYYGVRVLQVSHVHLWKSSSALRMERLFYAFLILVLITGCNVRLFSFGQGPTNNRS